MDSFMVGAQVLLAGVLALAGGAKLFDLQGSRRAMVDFGVPERAASVAGSLLPVVELVTAIALLLQPSARWGALSALVLLTLFIIGIANAMRAGRKPDCHCFGQVHSAPAGPWTLARNAALAALAAVVVWRGPDVAINSWVSERTTAELVALGTGIAALALVAFSWRLWSQNRTLQGHLAAARTALGERRPEREGLPVGAPAPSFTLTNIQGEAQTLESLRAPGRPVVLEFVDPGCGPCTKLMPLLARWQTALADRVTIAIVTSGSADDRPVWEEHGITNVLLDESDDVFKAFRVRSTPTAIAVNPDGTVASAPAGGLHMPEVLVRSIVRRAAAHEQVAPRASARPAVMQIEPHSA